jgi:DNA-binding transcriptional LysR family regulator
MDDGLSQKIATIAGAGISMNALWSVHRELAEGSLVRVLPDHKVGDQTALWLIYPKSNVLTAKVRIFIDFLLEKTGNTPAWASA